MAQTYVYTTYDGATKVKVLTDGLNLGQDILFINDIVGETPAVVRQGFNLKVGVTTTKVALEALATTANLSLDVYDDGSLVDEVSDAENTEAEITAYQFNGVSGETVVIDSAAGTIDVEVPFGTTVTALVATFTLSTDASAAIGETAQVSGTTANNFSTPKTYVVTSERGGTKSFVVTVTIAAE
jgi:hypothetical protein